MQQGLINKFNISRSDGTRLPDEAIFFVLRLDAHGDEKETNAAREAVLVYASLLENNPLVEDLRSLFNS